MPLSSLTFSPGPTPEGAPRDPSGAHALANVKMAGPSSPIWGGVPRASRRNGRWITGPRSGGDGAQASLSFGFPATSSDDAWSSFELSGLGRLSHCVAFGMMPWLMRGCPISPDATGCYRDSREARNILYNVLQQI
ncbi:hypothetical protein B0T21DRAFT_154808 [Apiosordaria backusii]|uniref:Uncharacterized protein n=1 Tax=Apiosordaria backusii TaxID=314023 RepID=A0AA40BMH6_9PEZI|nr:hypothetical protein B0T21DRAFT_154808 [Apiosordaria backusii]